MPGPNTCWYCRDGKPVELVARKPACEACASALREGVPTARAAVVRESVPPVRAAAREAIIKRCACGRTFTRAEWNALPYVGLLDEDGERLEHRNCPCGSTIVIDLNEPRVPDAAACA